MHRTLPLPSLILIALVSACGTQKVADDTTAPAAVTAAPDSSAQVAYEMALGTWDWANGDSTCRANTHVLSFSADTTEMILTFKEPLDTATGRREARYEILGAGSKVLPGLTYVIRGAMQGETRKSATGQFVLWDLVLATPNRYHWHRTDWPDANMTPAVIRCNGTTPLEDYKTTQPPGERQ